LVLLPRQRVISFLVQHAHWNRHSRTRAAALLALAVRSPADQLPLSSSA
jgi:hypothetical protein